MSKIRDLANIASTRIYDLLIGEENLESSEIVTIDKTLIENNMITLPRESRGNVIWNKAMIFDDIDSNIIVAEAICSTDGNNIIFNSNDNLNGKYCIVSYLTA